MTRAVLFAWAIEATRAGLRFSRLPSHVTPSLSALRAFQTIEVAPITSKRRRLLLPCFEILP